MDNKEKKGRQSSIDGFAHQHIVAGILMKRYERVSLAGSPLLSYDLLVGIQQDDGKEDIIRAQVKTVSPKGRLPFTGGGRGGIERKQISNVKIYTQSTQTSDVVIGFRPKNHRAFDLYFVPTVLIEALQQKGISTSRVEHLMNNYEIFRNCKDKNYVISKCKEYGIIST